MAGADRSDHSELKTAVDRLPATVRNKALTGGAARWLERLPEVLAQLEQRWSITIGHPYDDATEAFVADARRADGAPAVVKVLVPSHDRVVDEITVLELAAGRGCVPLLAADRTLGALLVERLGLPMVRFDLPLARRLEILTSLAQQVWRPAPGCGLATGADKARRLMGRIEELWSSLGEPCNRLAVDHALVCGRTRMAAHRQERAVLVHGDIHQWNALADTDGFTLVDPDGLLAEPEYDLGVLLREDPIELMAGDPRDRATLLATWTGLDAEAIWQWGVIERVATGLVATQVGLQPVGRQMLAAADRIAAESW